jgi:hypothetical protein
LTRVTAFGGKRLFTHGAADTLHKYITLNSKVMMNNKLKNIWKEAAMA